MSSSSNNGRSWLIDVAALALLALSLADVASAQQSPDARWQKAVSLFNSTAPGNAETACDMMKQLAQEFPGNQDYETSRRTFCTQVKAMLDAEKRSADEGMQFAKAGNCPGARSDYEKILPLGTRDSKYRDQLKAEVAACEGKMSAMSADRAQIDRARQLFHQGKDGEARKLLQPVASSRSAQAQEAKQLLTAIDQAEEQDRNSLNLARTLAGQDKKVEARELLRKVIQRGGPNSAEARQVLNSIGSAGSDEVLRAGLKEYFDGDLAKAEDDLTSYISSKGDREALAYFFRGVTRASRYFLSGETDTQQKSSALEDFHFVK